MGSLMQRSDKSDLGGKKEKKITLAATLRTYCGGKS